MPDRDLLWSEYLRLQVRVAHHPSSTDLGSEARRDEHDAALCGGACYTALPRSLQQLFEVAATWRQRRLCSLAKGFPKCFSPHVVTSLEFNDPYVPERMLAAAYGTTLSLVDSEAAPTFRPLLGDLAKTLYRKMFGFSARNATHHTLMRDYALGIIEIAQRSRVVSRCPRSASRDLAAPFPNTPSTFVSDGTSDPTVKKAIGHAIQMRFR